MKFVKCSLRFICVILILTTFSGCGIFTIVPEYVPSPQMSPPPPPPDFPAAVGDTVIEKAPKRVVSLSPMITEQMFALGYSRKLVGRSSLCNYPEEVIDELIDCGDALAPNLKVIAEINPALIVTSEQPTNSDMIEYQKRRIAVLVLHRANSLDELYANYTAICVAMEGDYAGRIKSSLYSKDYNKRISDLASRTKTAAADKQRKGVFMVSPAGFSATGDTLEGRLLTILSIDNIAGDSRGWSFPSSNFSSNAPDFIIAPSDITAELLSKYKDYRDLGAVKYDNILAVPLRAFQNQSERMIDEAESIAAYAYPQISG